MLRLRITFGTLLLLVGTWQGGIAHSVAAQDQTLKQILKNPSTQAQDLIQLGHTYLRAGNHKQAQKAFQKAINKGAKAAGYDGLGLICAQTRGKGLRAQYWFRRALSADRTYADAQYHLAQMYLKMRPSDALGAFEKTIDIDPNHPNAHFAIAQLLEKRNNLDWAMTSYRKQIDVTPDHHRAQYHLAKLLLKRHQAPEALTLFKYLATTDNDFQALAYLELAKISHLTGQIPTAQKLFEAYIACLPDAEQALYHDITLVASQDELAIYNAAPYTQRMDLQRRFWNRADPTPLTVENERLIEHYRRVAYARAKFSKNHFPWDDRGDVYVRLGSPDHISRSDDVQATFDIAIQHARQQFAIHHHNTDAITPGHPLLASNTQWEYWIYAHLAGGAEIAFAAPFSDGTYRFAPLAQEHSLEQTLGLWVAHGDLFVQNFAAHTPSVYTPNFADLPIEFTTYPASYRGTNGKTRLEIYGGLSASDASRLSPKNNTIQLERGITVYDSLWHNVYTLNDTLAFAAPKESDVIKGAFLPDIATIDLPPGPYRIRLQVRDPITGQSRIYQHNVVLDNYHTNQLQLSDIELAFAIKPETKKDPFVKQGLKIIPKSSRTFRNGQNAFVYFETYHLHRDDLGQKRYQVSYTIRPYKDRAIAGKVLHGLTRALRLGPKDETITVTYDQVNHTPDEVTYLELDLDTHGPGYYRVQIAVTDLITNQHTSKNVTFQITP